MKAIISKGLTNSFTYFDYRKIIIDLLSEGKSTGNKQSDDLTQYSLLNETRMHRLDKTIVVLDENIQQLKVLKKKYIWLVISEGWCGDAAQILPVLNKLDQFSPTIEMKIVLRDDNPELMDLFLTHGAKSIPKLIVLDQETLEVAGNWGPRPKGAYELIQSYKEKTGTTDLELKTELQLWYLHDKGIGIQNEVADLMVSIDTTTVLKNSY